MRRLNKIILHCSDSDNYRHDNIAEIDRWHRERGWRKIGYHFFIDKQGELFEGRPIHEKGAHCYGQNRNSIGICLSGRHDFQDIQLTTLQELILRLWHDYGRLSIHGHCEFNSNKSCPNFDYIPFVNEIMKYFPRG